MTRRFPSIVSRIVSLHILALLAIGLVVSSAAYLLLNSTVNDFEESILRDHAENVAQYLTFSDGRWSVSLPPDLQATYRRAYGGFALTVVDDTGATAFSSSPDNTPLFTAPEDRQHIVFSKERHGNSMYYALGFPVTRDQHQAWVQVAQNQGDPDVIVDDVLAKFLRRISFVVVPILIVLFVVDVVIIRRALAPILEASELAEAIGTGRADVRLPVNDLPREVRPLAQAVNDGLERLGRAFRLQRDFTANAAHELRTPLTILRTQTDVMTGSPVAQSLQVEIDAMSRLIDQLLQLAELETFDDASRETIDLNTVCANVVAATAPAALADDKATGFTPAADAILIKGNAELLFRAVKNLVENAIRHTPPGTTVDVQVSTPATITVEDRGPGIAPHERAFIFRRFWRKNRSDTRHSGLGLSIVSEIARVHHAEVDVIDRPGGGAIFRLVFGQAVTMERGTSALPA
jgi:signal transduction histidine kinase